MKNRPTNIIIVGGQRRGKSTFVKTALKKSNFPLFAYDVNGEYGRKFQGSMEDFLNQAKGLSRVKLVFEEATIFFSNRGRSEEIIEILVKHNGNINFFCFHSLRAIPTYILELCHFFVLFKTKDNPTAVNSKYKDFPEILSLYNLVNENPDFHFFKTLNIEP